MVSSWLISVCTAVLVFVALGTVWRFPGLVCFLRAVVVVSFLPAIKFTDTFV